LKIWEEIFCAGVMTSMFRNEIPAFRIFPSNAVQHMTTDAPLRVLNFRFGRVSRFPIEKQGTFVQACAAESHSCVLDIEGKIFCWGLNTLDRAKVPDALESVKWKLLSCAGGHTCAIDERGWPACWGFGQHGQVTWTSRCAVE
jgi:alpha-tubulin suppressor-like RCC1 family protein